MNALLAEIGKRLADRWVELLVLPGLLWVATLALAVHLGQRQAFDVAGAHTWLERVAADPAVHSVAAVVLVSVGVLLASAAAGLAVAALGGCLQRLWVSPASGLVLRMVLRLRRRRWDAVSEQLRSAIATSVRPSTELAEREHAAAVAQRSHRRRALMGGVPPTEATWIGQRFRATADGVERAYGFDLDLAWPRLWTLLPDALRTDISGALSSYLAAARLTAWGVMYGVLAALWWPAAPLGLCVLVAGVTRARSAAVLLADLTETAFDLHAGALAERLGQPSSLPLPRDVGRTITEILRKAPNHAETGPFPGPHETLSAAREEHEHT